jgi:SAM-dependent methyltransferase
MDILNLGAGNKIIAGAVNHDLRKHRKEIDVAHDLNILPWPWADESFDVIVARAVFEHLDNDLMVTLNECWRILRPGGKLGIKLPLWSAERAHDDPTHRWFFTIRSLDQFCPDTKRGRQYAFYTDRKWKFVKRPKVNKAQTSFYATLSPIKGTLEAVKVEKAG